MGRPARWAPMVQASRDEACLAVRLYNDPAEVRSFEAFIVHMHLAWLYLLHAEFTRDNVDIRYRRADNPRLLARVDGEPKRWELAKCVQEHWPTDGAVRANLEFFIALRNKIEHRFTRHQTELALAVGGRSQALLLNYEGELTSQFGSDVSLATTLRFPLFIGTFTEDGERALAALRAKLPKSLQTFLAKSTADLPSAIRDDQKFDLRLRVALELTGNPANGLAIQFTRFDDMTDEQKKAVAEMGNTGTVFVRDQKRNVSNLGWLKPRQVVREVASRIPFKFNMAYFVKAWKAEAIRPVTDSASPHRTKAQYCTYDEPHKDYIYSPKYVERLVEKLSTEDGFRSMIGTDPRPLPAPTAVAS